MRKLLVVLLCLIAALAPTASHASPSNDAFADAEAFSSLPFSDDLETASAYTEVLDPGNACAEVSHSVWYRFEPSTDVKVQLDTIGSDFSTAIAVFVGPDYLHLRQIMCDSYDEGLLAFGARAGTVYYVQIGAGSNSIPMDGRAGHLLFHASAVGGPVVYRPPLNDAVTDATLIDSIPFEDTVYLGSASYDDVTAAGVQTPINSNLFPNNASGDVWYRWTAPRSGKLAITSWRSPDGGCTFTVYRSGPSGLQMIDSGTRMSDYSWDTIYNAAIPVTQDTEYWIAFEGTRGVFDNPGHIEIGWAPQDDLSVHDVAVDDPGPDGKGSIDFTYSAPWAVDWTVAACPDGQPEPACETIASDQSVNWWGPGGRISVEWRSLGCVGDWTITVSVSWYVDDPDPSNNLAMTRVSFPGSGVGVGAGSCSILGPLV